MKIDLMFISCTKRFICLDNTIYERFTDLQEGSTKYFSGYSLYLTKSPFSGFRAIK